MFCGCAIFLHLLTFFDVFIVCNCLHVQVIKQICIKKVIQSWWLCLTREKLCFLNAQLNKCTRLDEWMHAKKCMEHDHHRRAQRLKRKSETGKLFLMKKKYRDATSSAFQSRLFDVWTRLKMLKTKIYWNLHTIHLWRCLFHHF